LRGIVSQADLDSFVADGSLLGVHPECDLPGIDFSSGSLGQGLSYGAGAALAGRMQKSARRAFVLLSDGECNEGSIWEGAMFAAHHRLGNLTAIIDLNGQQALGYTKDVMNLADMAGRWRAFGWDVHEVDGHNPAAMRQAMDSFDFNGTQPHLLLARTTFGKGVSFMQNEIAWHYLPMNDEQYVQALAEVEAA
jgi:transketolase